jgi:heptosyltransferase-2
MMSKEDIVYYRDCSHFRGDVPCRPHKEHGVHCEGCPYYNPKSRKLLVIKLGAIGDVIRTTPLLHRIRQEEPDAAVWWLTYSPDVVPQGVEKVLAFTPENLLVVQATDFDVLINLDKDPHACALAKNINAATKYGFTLEDGKPAPINDLAKHKYMTGLFDDINKANELSYPEEIFGICGWDFRGEDYILDVDKSFKWDIPSEGKPVIGLNTGCGDRWVSRLWAGENWEKLISLLSENGFFPLLLGGKQEHEKNQRLSEKTGAFYPGNFPLKQFISLMDQCSLVVTAVTMGLHIAVGLHKPVVLINNIFNPKEFELYGRGEIVQPELECKCFFSPKCINPDYFCLDHLRPETLFEAVKRNLK